MIAPLVLADSAGFMTGVLAISATMERPHTMDKKLQGVLVFFVVGALYGLALFSGIRLTIAEQTLLVFLPALACWDFMNRSVPVIAFVPLFGFAAIEHWLVFQPWQPLFALLLILPLLALPLWLDKFALGDRLVVAWLVYALGLLGVIATIAAVLTSMGRKNVPFVTHLAFATVILLVPFALYGLHVGRLAWRF